MPDIKNTNGRNRRPKIIQRIVTALVPADRGRNWELAAKIFVAVGLFFAPIFIAGWSDDAWEMQKLLLLLVVVLGGWLCLMVAMMKRQSDRWSWHPLDILVLLFGLAVTISALTSMNWWASLFGASGWASHSLLATWVFIGLYFLVVKLFHQPADRRLAWLLVIIGVGISLVLQVFQFANLSLLFSPFRDNRWFSTLSSFNLQVTVLAALFAAGLMMLWTVTTEAWGKLLLAAGIVTAWLVLFFSGRPLGWAVFAIGAVAVVWHQARDNRRTDLRLVIGAVILAALGLIAQMTNLAAHSGVPRLQELTLDHGTSYHVTTATLAHRLVLGAGPSAWYEAFVKYRPESFNQKSYWDVRFVQGSSDWLQTFTTMGLAGGLLLLGIVVLGGWMCWRGWRQNGDPFLMLSGLLLVVVLVTGFITTWSLVLMMLAWVGIGFGRTTMTDWSKEKTRSLPGWSYAVMAVATLVAIGLCVPFIGVYASNALTYRAAEIAKNRPAVNVVINKLKLALSFDRRNESASRYLAQIYDQKVTYDANRQDYTTASKDITLARQTIQQAISLDKNNPALYEADNQLLNDLASVIPNAVTQAKNNYVTLRKIEPASPIHDVAYGQTVMLETASATDSNGKATATANQLDAALNIAIPAFNQALVKKPNYFQARLAKAQAFLSAKHDNEALAVFPDLNTHSASERGMIWQVIAEANAGLGKNDLAATAYAESIKAYDQDASAYINAAAFYAQIGKKDKAKQMISDGKKAIPSYTQFDAVSKSLEL